MFKQFLQYVLIWRSGAFDSQYYLLQNPDVRKNDADPLKHFLRFGWKEGRSPNAYFDVGFYLGNSPDIKQAGVNPLFHYVRHGWKEGRNPSAIFNGNQYLQRFPDVKASRMNPLTHYLRYGRREVRSIPGLRQPVEAAQVSPRGDVGSGTSTYDPAGSSALAVFSSRVKRKLGNSLHAQTAPLDVEEGGGAVYAQAYADMSENANTTQTNSYVEFAPSAASAAPVDVKTIAFYLPQFHPIPENDTWWGRGFTEWTNVTKAVPQFLGHYQPHLPGELGFYDLRVPEVQMRQVALAKNYGVYGFCFHYYWFSGKHLLDLPLRQFASNPEIDFPFCISWANENWTRRWDGLEKDILIAQDHTFENDKDFIADIFVYLQHKNYIMVKGRPLVIVYRAGLLKNARKTTDYWRDYCVERGLPNPFLVAAQTFQEFDDPRKLGFDAAIEFPPHNNPRFGFMNLNKQVQMLNPEFSGNIYDYRDLVRSFTDSSNTLDFPLIKTTVPGWDNEPRKAGRGNAFVNATPERFTAWMQSAIAYARAHPILDERLVFVNSWNEWGEGAHLEPDRKYGYAYLQAIADAVRAQAPEPPAQVKSGHRSEQIVDRSQGKVNAYYHALFQQKMDQLVRLLGNGFSYQEGRGYAPAGEPLAKRVEALFSAEAVDDPEASVIIPVYNNFDETLTCLLAILSAADKTKTEIILINDHSSEPQLRVFAHCKRIKYLENEENLGFLRSCNKAAKAASGKVLVFLNNDTLALPGWLDQLMQTFVDFPGTGYVGSKLLYPNGFLQEAGSVIWSDASGINYGWGDDPQKPEYNFAREVDYASGACIVTPAEVWKALGGFDEIFSPAYYEDTDYAFRVRQAGKKVMYQPFSQVFHVEGGTSGTDLTKGQKAYQVLNRQKFLERWQNVLSRHQKNEAENPSTSSNMKKARALVIDVCVPRPDQDSGSIDTFQYLLAMRDLGFEVTFIPFNASEKEDRYVVDLLRLGIKCLYPPYIGSIDEYIQKHGREYAFAMLFRAPYGGRFVDVIRKYAPDTKIVFNTVDLHFLREKRAAELVQKGGQKTAIALEGVSQKTEIGLMKKSDATIVVSDFEKKLLNEMDSAINVKAISICREFHGLSSPFEEREDIVFLGGYLHQPNVDAVLYFVNEIWPTVKAGLPECKFIIAGSNPPETLLTLAAEDIVVTGFVEDLDTLFEKVKLSIAPLRFGAGVKGKVVTSLSYGVPCVVTTLAAEGMGLVDGEHAFIADEPVPFAEALVSLYTNEEIWNKFSQNGQALVNKKYSTETFQADFSSMLTELGLIGEGK